ncbi:hypothetical protein DI005_23420 [Prauserella sp. PE36]|uniref:LysR family transcriptional regulator n=1 Tax=Prauserella endophytica TaxID=1592324 RepID=A0ABY2S9M8_9PSEU|nr:MULTISPECIES: LysR substrate-binding domain-containing protein [Prauserella]RBM17236.1 hypothetical protein DI005_23420 [Prauserella sp. PE36]TKG72592.1 LysR family transcriptional regulator [Prauserella endophytica]
MAVELRLMRYVIAISEAGSFEAAAARLHMTQPPLSRQIRELERELGVELFHRRPTRLTSAGEVFVASAKEILAATDQLVRDVRAEGDAHYDTVRVGYTLTTAFSEMPALVAFLRDHHAGIVVDAHEAWDTELTAALDEGRLDVVIGRFVSVPRSCRTRGLRRDRFAIVVGAGHPLAGEDSVSLTDLRGQTLRFFPRSFAPRYHDAALAALHSTGETFDIWENPLPGLRNLNVHLRDGGFMFLPRSLGDHLPKGLVCLPLQQALPADLDILWRQPPSPAARAFIRAAVEFARAEGWLPQD